MIKVCAECGKRFEASHGRVAYCSEECRKTAKTRQVMIFYWKKKGQADGTGVKICPVCGVKFIKKKAKYCSIDCRMASKEKKERKNHKWAKPNDTLCWYCENASKADNKCPWASGYKPVPGWKAQASETYADGYKVKECPLFKEG